MKSMKIIKLSMLTLTVVQPYLVRAAWQTVGDYTWKYRIIGNAAEIYGSMSDSGNGYPSVEYNPTGSITIPSALGGKPVKSIGEYAFYWCENIINVIIPNSVTNIGDQAFYWCTKLRSVAIPNGVTSIGDHAFYNCSSLTNVVIPSSTTSIGGGAFGYCIGLTSITIPNGMTCIEQSMFSGCERLKSVTIPECITSIGSSAFMDCKSLRSLIIPSNVKSIGSMAFARSGLNFIAFKGNAPTLGYTVFNGMINSSSCWALVTPESTGWKVSIPGNWNDIGINYLQAAKFNANGGSVSAPDCYLAPGEAVGMLPTPNRTGYSFNGWYTTANGGNKISEDTTLAASYTSEYVDKTYYAHWTVNQYAVMFDANGGTGGMILSQNYGTSISAPMVSRIGYSFNGWSPTVTSTVPASNVTYKAQWIANAYTIAYEANGGSGTMDATDCSYDSEATVAPNGFTCAHRVFAGWATNAMGEVVYTAGQPVTNLTTQAGGVVTLYAVWESFIPTITPESRTLFENSLTVTMSCPKEGTTIHYTTDGSEPTAESPVYKRFRIYGKTTVKAVAELDGVLSDVIVAHYALGQCADPVISLADGTVFEHSNQEVSIDWTETDGVLRYTLDGSEPTSESPAYDGPFTISESTVVKAKVFSDDFFDSAVVTSSLTRVRTNVATPVIDAASSFAGSKAKVTLSCATDGALVRYTLNGNDPNSHATKYTGPFYVTESCTVKAYATMADYLDSAVATQVVEKVWSIGDTMGKPDHGFTTSGSGGGTGWTRVVDATAANGEAMKSGAITDKQSSILSTTVVGPGTLSFSWRTSCEEDAMHEWDHAEFAVDGTVRLVLDGVNGWQDASVAITGDSEHTVEWRYVKDDVESEGEDAAWVANYQWESGWTATRTTGVPVPYDWLVRHDPDVVDEYAAYEVSAKGKAANPRYTMEEAYVAGIDPVDPSAEFMATITISNGMPVVTWEPDLNTNGIIRTYKVYGCETLEGGGDWQYPTNKLHRFFKVEVDMP